jgi:hypothetical protein
MAMDPPGLALAVEACWLGRVMQSDLVVSGRRGRTYVVGEGRGASFPLDRGALGGVDSCELIGRDGTIHVPGCACEASLVRKGEVQPSPVMPPAKIKLGLGERASVRLADLVFEVRAVRLPSRLRLPLGFDWKAFFIGLGGVPLVILAILFMLEYMERGHRRPLARLEIVARLLFPEVAGSRGPTPEEWIRSDGTGNRVVEPVGPCASMPQGSSSSVFSGGQTIAVPAPVGFTASGNDHGEAVPAAYEPLVLLGYGMCIQRDH